MFPHTKVWSATVVVLHSVCLTWCLYPFPPDRLLPSEFQTFNHNYTESNPQSLSDELSNYLSDQSPSPRPRNTFEQLTDAIDVHNQTVITDSPSVTEDEEFLRQLLLHNDHSLPETVPSDDAPSVAIFWWTPTSYPSWPDSGDPNTEQLDQLDQSEHTKADPTNNKLVGVRAKRVSTVHALPRCSMTTYERCLVMMQEVMQNKSLAFPTSVTELDITCKKLKAGDHCAERYIRTCAGDQQRLLYQDIVHGTKKVIRLICQQGETQLMYLEFASCFKDIFVSESKCSKVLNRFQEISRLMSSGTSALPSVNDPGLNAATVTVSVPSAVAEERLKQFCCAYRDVVNCQLKNVRRVCGTRGMDFFDKYMSEMTNSLINEHCVGYTYSNKCVPYQVNEVESVAREYSAQNTVDTVHSDAANQHRVKSMLALSGLTKPIASTTDGAHPRHCHHWWWTTSLAVLLTGLSL